MLFPTRKTYFADCVFDILANVYEPAEDSFLLAESLIVQKNDTVLDMGTGCGILGILVAKEAGEIVAVDLNPYATRCAMQNAKLNNVQTRFRCFQSDLFLSFRYEKKFDLILFNPPYLPVEVSDENCWLERSWAGGSTGRQIIDRFISQVPKHLTQEGRVLFLQSTLADVRKTMLAFNRQDFETKVIKEQSLPFFENLFLIEAKKRL